MPCIFFILIVIIIKIFKYYLLILLIEVTDSVFNIFVINVIIHISCARPRIILNLKNIQLIFYINSNWVVFLKKTQRLLLSFFPFFPMTVLRVIIVNGKLKCAHLTQEGFLIQSIMDQTFIFCGNFKEGKSLFLSMDIKKYLRCFKKLERILCDQHKL